jgi:hypothetical protein
MHTPRDINICQDIVFKAIFTQDSAQSASRIAAEFCPNCLLFEYGVLYEEGQNSMS